MEMTKVFFISDLHIGAGNQVEEQPKLTRLFTFFQHINKPGNELFIVGDLFDFWFEYRHVIPKHSFEVFYHLHQLIRNQVTVHFLPGNHDSWIGDFFAEQVSMFVHPEMAAIERQSKKLLLFHGDGISKKDVGYRILKKVFRNPVNIFLYRLVHPDIGIPIAKLMSMGSRKHTAGKVLNDEEDYWNFALEKFQSGFDYVIVGHSHQPLLRQLGSQALLNLGDWIHHFSYGELNQGNLTLRYWNS